ncbi:hypothetical protein TRFO_22973 [Tritrichomonas foetus]|uniref:Uncharacterized protein n=1 Tax=Tritrichomonas foetus TaxID=1144522 RepID=A0A1J4KFQ9_9EUKA|nr:hypothetical protein TRFO_22973 [Tritrichomonas foetus]|eukprot:OHT08470.1 hypothetical protein TRFO_22973 [Tritrichomonas foetus]
MNNDHNHSQSINSINFYFKNILKNIQDDINSHIDIDHIISKEEQNQYQNQMELDYWNVFFNGINREKNDEKISKDMITDIKNIIDKWKYDIVPWLQIEEIIVDYISESPCYQLKIDDALYRIDNFVNGKVVSIEEKESRIVFITTLLKNCATYACHDGYLPLFTLLQADTIQSVLKQNQSLLLSSLDSPIFMKMLLLCSIIDFVDIFKLIFVIGFGNGNPHLYCGILDSFEIKDLLNVLCWDFYCLFTTKKADEWKSILKEALNFDDNFIRVNDCKVISGLQWKDNLLETFPHNFGPMSPVKKSDIFLGKESKNINTNSQSDPIFFQFKGN